MAAVSRRSSIGELERMPDRVTGALSIALLAFGLSGCFVPSRFSGYKPTGQGILKSGYCVAGVEDNLHIPAASGVKIMVRAYEQRNTLHLALDLDIPSGVSARLLSQDLVLRSQEWSAARLLPVDHISAPGPREYKPTDVLAGASDQTMGMFSLNFQKRVLNETAIPAPLRFSMSLPSMTIDGVIFQPAPIYFEPYREWGFYYCVQ